MNIIINRTDAIGDTLLTLPMARAIKQKFPQAKIAFIINPKCVDLFKDLDYVDEVWTYRLKKTWLFNLFSLRKKFTQFRPTHYFHVGGSFIPSLTALMKSVPFRGGLKSRWQSFLLLNKGVRQVRSMVTMHESEYNLELLRPMGIRDEIGKGAELAPLLSLHESALENPEDWQKKDFIIIHPGMSGHTLNWPTKNYGRLIARLMEDPDKKDLGIVLSFTPADKSYIEEVLLFLKSNGVKDWESRLIMFDGSILGLSHFASILSKAKLFIGPSTGTTHIANSLNIPQIAFFSPIKVQSVERWGPYRIDGNVSIHVPEVVCGESKKCAEKECPYYECMGRIEVGDIFQDVMRFLGPH